MTEVIQIRRQFGQWPGGDGIDDLSRLEPCNYVEVVKLTGDPNVPAGQASLFSTQYIMILNLLHFF